MSLNQLVTLVILVAALLLIYRRRRKERLSPHPRGSPPQPIADPELVKLRDWPELADEICSSVFAGEDPIALKALFERCRFSFSRLHEFAHDPPPEVVETVVRSAFPDRSVSDVFSILGKYCNYGPVVPQGRIYLDIARASGGQFERLAALVKTASTDFRDIIAVSESPAFVKMLFELQPSAARPTEQRLRNAADSDLKEFVHWLRRHNTSR